MRFLTLFTALLALSACAAQPARTATSPADSMGRTPSSHAAKPKITARQMLGQSDAWLLANLGEPHFMRADRVANIWQYKNGTCMLNVFLYGDELSATALKHVLHFDARDNTGQNTDREHCLSVLQE